MCHLQTGLVLTLSEAECCPWHVRSIHCMLLWLFWSLSFPFNTWQWTLATLITYVCTLSPIARSLHALTVYVLALDIDTYVLYIRRQPMWSGVCSQLTSSRPRSWSWQWYGIGCLCGTYGQDQHIGHSIAKCSGVLLVVVVGSGRLWYSWWIS